MSGADFRASAREEGVCVLDWFKNWLAVPRRVKEIQVAGELTDAAIAELNSAVDEVASELDAIAGDADEETAARLAPISARLRGLYTPPEETPDVPA